MSENKFISQVSVSLDQNVYNAFRNLQYKYWYAMSEFVDNAIQSYIDNKVSLDSLYNIENSKFSIKIDIEPNYIRIFDNAGGISYENFIKAFKPGKLPENREGLNEFGMGMKVAAVWFCDLYQVRSVALGEGVERIVEFDRIKVTEQGLEDLTVQNKTVSKDLHYTEIVLSNLNPDNAPIHHKQIEKLEKHLSDIYRNYLRQGVVEIIINGDKLTFDEPVVLKAREQDIHNREKGENREWRKDVDIKLGENFRIHGFLALMDKMDQRHNGLSLFRRGRIIQGSHDEKYFPSFLFGQPGSSLYRLLFGELNIDGFDVSFNKGSFTNVQDLDALLLLIKDECSGLLSQGRNYRKKNDSNRKLGENEVNKTDLLVKKSIEEIQRKTDFTSLSRQVSIEKKGSPLNLDYDSHFLNTSKIIDKFKDFYMTQPNGLMISVEVKIERDLQDSRMYKIKKLDNKYTALINIGHDYFISFDPKKDGAAIEATLEVLTVVVLSDIQTSMASQDQSDFRYNFNKYLKEIHGREN
jgi:hypothetical protein